MAAAAIAALGVLALAGTGPDPIVVLATGIAIGVVVVSLIDVVRAAPVGPAPPVAQITATAPRVDARIRSLRFNLRSMRDERADRLHRSLVELIDDQLLVAHGIDRARQPDRAAAVLGAELQAFLDESSTARIVANPERLERIVDEIEQL